MVKKDNERDIDKHNSALLGPREKQALLDALVAQATRRGETLASLARHLGVSYERLAQWRRGEADIRHAKSAVHERAGQYLGIPTVLVLVLAGIVKAEQFVWPSRDALAPRLEQELERLRQHPLLGPFVPQELRHATPAVKLFVAFLFHELSGNFEGGPRPNFRWLNALQQVTNASAQAVGQCDSKAPLGDNLFDM